MDSSCMDEIPTIIDYDNDPEDVQDQMEMFLHKFPEVDRDGVSDLLQTFMKVDLDRDGILEQDQTLRLWEKQGKPQSVGQLRQIVTSVLPMKKNKRMNFLECAACFYQKSWEELHKFVDRKAYEEAIASIEEAKVVSEQAAAALQELKEKEIQEEEERLAAMKTKETEVHVVGVRGAAAFFQQKIDAASDHTHDNMQKVHAASAQRKELKKAKDLEAKALLQAQRAQNSALVRENAEQEMAQAKAEAEERRKQLEQEQLEAERKRRAEFRARNEALFGGTK